MSVTNFPLKRPLEDEDSRKRKKQSLMEAVDAQQVSYVTPFDEDYPQLVASKYANFAHQPSNELPKDLQQNLAWAFNTLQANGLFHRDWVRVKGRSFPTYVSRVLIGEPGVTYKYLGLRLFALPWSFEGRSPTNDVEEACHILGQLNAYFKQTSRKLICEKIKSNSTGTTCATTSTSASMKYKTTCVNGDHERLHNRILKVERNQNKHLRFSEEVESKEGEGACAIKSSNNVIENDQKLDPVLDRTCDSSYVETVDKDSSRASEVSQSKVASLDPDASKDNNVKESCSSSNTEVEDSKSNIPSAISAELQHSEGNAVDDVSGSSKPVVELSQPKPPSSDPSLLSDSSVDEGTKFNVALLNYMDPDDPNLHLKEEPYYGMGELAVSWHMDTGLIKGSTVAVYNRTEAENCKREDCNKWCIGVKVQWDVETPALAVPLDSGDAYYMLSDLNDTHQHCVVVGSHPRYSSTHRLAECSRGTLSYIQTQCMQALDNLDAGNDEDACLKSTSVEAISLAEDIHTEVEFEWLRQFWMQGLTRANERTFWKQPMEELEEMWTRMELMTKLAIDVAMQSSNSELCESLIDNLSRRNGLRQEHINRFGGKSLVTMPSDEMPSYRPYWQNADADHPLPFDLDDVIHRLACHLDAEPT